MTGALERVSVSGAAATPDLDLIALVKADVGELGRTRRPKRFDERLKLALPGSFDGDAGKRAGRAAGRSPGTGFRVVHEHAYANLGRFNSDGPLRRQAAAELAWTAGVGPQRIGQHTDRKTGFEHLDRRDPAIAMNMILAVVPVLAGAASPFSDRKSRQAVSVVGNCCGVSMLRPCELSSV